MTDGTVTIAEAGDGVKLTKRGYATRGLTLVAPDDDRYWSVSDASMILGPPDRTELEVWQLIHLFHLEPAGKRVGGSRRRHVRVYDANVLAKAHAAIASVMLEYAS